MTYSDSIRQIDREMFDEKVMAYTLQYCHDPVDAFDAVQNYLDKEISKRRYLNRVRRACNCYQVASTLVDLIDEWENG